MKLIEDGGVKKLLSDPKEIAEFIVFKSNRKAYDERMKNIGRTEAIYEKSSTPTIPAAAASVQHSQAQSKGEKKFNANNW
jgi:hypothetical protein